MFVGNERTDDEQAEEDAHAARLLLLLSFDTRLNRQDGLEHGGRGQRRRLASGRGAVGRVIAGSFCAVYSTGVQRKRYKRTFSSIEKNRFDSFDSFICN